jgi:hypothetical protein
MEGLALPIFSRSILVIMFCCGWQRKSECNNKRGLPLHAAVSSLKQPMAKKSAWRCMRGENGLPFAAGFNVLYGRVLQKRA